MEYSDTNASDSTELKGAGSETVPMEVPTKAGKTPPTSRILQKATPKKDRDEGATSQSSWKETSKPKRKTQHSMLNVPTNPEETPGTFITKIRKELKGKSLQAMIEIIRKLKDIQVSMLISDIKAGSYTKSESSLIRVAIKKSRN